MSNENHNADEEKMTAEQCMRLAIIDSSDTWYAQPRLVYEELIKVGHECLWLARPNHEGAKTNNVPPGYLTICIANNVSPIDIATGEPLTLSHPPLERAYRSMADFIFVGDKTTFLNFFTTMPNAFYMPYAVDPGVYHPLANVRECYDVGFIGNLKTKERIQRISIIQKRFSFLLKSDAFMADANAALNRCRIVFNTSDGKEINMRVFEALATGKLLVTNRIAYLDELFKDGVHLVTYSDEREMIEKISYYLNNEKERKAIARQGFEMVKKHHTYRQRAEYIIEKILQSQSSYLKKERQHFRDSKSFRLFYEKQSEKIGVAQERLFNPLIPDPDTGGKYNPQGRLKEALKIARGKILDIGCQRSGYCYHLKKNGMDVVGIDISLGYLRMARQQTPGVPYVAADAENLPFRNAIFDTVLLSEILEHVMDEEHAVAEAARVLKPGGTVFVTVSAYKADSKEHVRFLNKKRLAALFHGFSISFRDNFGVQSIILAAKKKSLDSPVAMDLQITQSGADRQFVSNNPESMLKQEGLCMLNDVNSCNVDTGSNLSFSNCKIKNGKHPLSILLTNHHLTDFTGSEVFTFTIADFLMRKGHKVAVLSKYVGNSIRCYFENIGVPIVQDVAGFGSSQFDVAHIHHNVMGMEVRQHYPSLPLVFLSHGVLPFLEQPPPVDIGIGQYLAVSEEVQENLARKGASEFHVEIFRNIVDSSKFYPRRPITAHPTRALVLSNKIDLQTEQTIQEACNRLDIAVSFAGMRFGTIHQHYLAEAINHADLVFTLGRGVIETMMCGRVPIVLDYDGGDGIVTPDNLALLMKRNLSGRTYRRRYNVEELIKEIGCYEASFGEALREMAVKLYDAESRMDDLVASYRTVMHREIPPMDERSRALIDAFLATVDTTRHFAGVEASRCIKKNADFTPEKAVETIDRLLPARLEKLVYLKKEHATTKQCGTDTECTYDILIPIYNAYEHLERCIRSVIQHTLGNHQICLLDDGSTDLRVMPMLRSFEKADSRIRVIPSCTNLGFVQTINRGFAISQNDVVILNSDTQVTAGWLKKMRRCQTSRQNIGIVCPLSNNATILSVPVMNQSNSLPEGMKPDDIAAIVAEVSQKSYPEIPTGVGFCMLITRQTLKCTGFFDPAFGFGYGEENDLCMKARAAGKKIVCCDDAYVHHYGEASFGATAHISEKRRQNEILLERRWPNYKSDIYQFCCNNPLRETQERISNRLRGINENTLPKIVHIIHNFNARAGTELHTRNIIDGLHSRFQSTVLFPGSLPTVWIDFAEFKASRHLRVLTLRKESIAANDSFLGFYGDLTNAHVESVFSNFLSGGDYPAVHFQHLAGWNSLVLPIIAKAHGCSVVISLHDYYLLCPEYNLVLPDLQRCGKPMADGKDSDCLYCLGTKRLYHGSGKPLLLRDYLIQRKQLVKRIFEAADVLVAPSKFVSDRFVTAYGAVIKDKIRTIPHGIELMDKIARPKTGDLLKVGFLGNAYDRKGIYVFLQAAARLKGKSVQFEIFGGFPPAFAKAANDLGIIQHGYYNRRDLPRLLSKIHLVLIPSIWDETFCLTASEALIMGIPIIASDCGAIRERIVDGENGFLVPAGDAKALAAKLIEVMEHPGMLEKVASHLQGYRTKTLKENTEDYAELYNKLLFKSGTTTAQENEKIEDVTKKQGLLSIVILTYNELAYTKRCVESIQRHTPEPHEIIFVDNGSNNGTLKWLRNLIEDNPEYCLIENRTNLGFSRGCNQGIESARGDWVLLLNNDTVVTEGWVSGMLECLKKSPDVGIVGPMTNRISGIQQVPAFRYSNIEEFWQFAKTFRDRNRYRRIESRRIVGFCMLFRKRLVHEIGYLDESFGSGNFEDDDFCLRSLLAGYRNLIAGDVFIHHYGSRTFIGNRIDYSASITGNRKVFDAKWGSKEVIQQFGNKLIIQNAVNRAEEFSRKGDIEQATAFMLMVIKEAPGDSKWYFRLSEMLIDAKHWSQAQEILESIPQTGNDAKQLSLMGYCQEALGNDDRAIELVERALAIEPTMPLALNVRGVLAYKRGELEDAEIFFNSAIEADPSFGESYTNLGSMKWAAGEHEQALDLFERGFILAPTTGDLAAAYHTAVVETRSFPRAEAVLTEACALHPNDRRIAFIKIAVLIQQEKSEEAMDAIEKAMLMFGIDDGMLSAAQGVRGRIGPISIRTADTRKKLSVCTIVKNEESHLARSLASIKPIAGEIIVVDTGSTDRTKAIAIAMGANVFDFPWTNDFSEARNFSLSKASGGWILVLDADEVISPLDHPRLKKIIKGTAKNRAAYTMVTRNYTDQAGARDWSPNEGSYIQEEAGKGWIPSPKVRLFPNDPRVHFVNPVHELVEPSLKKSGIQIKDCAVPVHHYGRLNQEKLKAKGEAYYQLGVEKIEKNKGDYNALRELAIQAAEIGRYAEAVDIWQRAIALKPEDASAYMNLGYAHLMLQQYDKVTQYSQKALELNPDLREAELNQAAAELIAGDVNNAISLLEGILSKHPNHPSAMGRLVAAYIISGRNEAGLAFLDRLVQLGFNCAEIMEEQARAFYSKGKTENAVLLLHSAIANGVTNERIQALVAEWRRQLTGVEDGPGMNNTISQAAAQRSVHRIGKTTPQPSI